MTRFCHSIVLALCGLTLATAGLANAETLLVQTERRPTVTLSPDNPVFSLNPHDLFQKFPAPGPVVQFVADMAVPVGEREIVFFGVPELFTVYETHDPSLANYSDLTQISAGDFRFVERRFDVQLLPQSAPQSVANFLTYVRDDAFDHTFIHQNTQHHFVQHIIQAGSFTVYAPENPHTGAHFAEPIPTVGHLPLEYEVPNTPGTLAVARGAGDLESGSSGFFFNLSDNSTSFGEANVDAGEPLLAHYAVFGRLAHAADLALLSALADVRVWDDDLVFLSRDPTDETTSHALALLQATFPFLPLWNFEFYEELGNEKASFVTFRDIVPPTNGNTAGITYELSLVTEVPVLDAFGAAVHDDSGLPTSRVVPAHRDSFTALDQNAQGHWTLTAVDTGEITLALTATDPTLAQTGTTYINLQAVNPGLIDYFGGSLAVAPGGWYHTWYGWVQDQLPFGASAVELDPEAPPNEPLTRENGGWFWHIDHTNQFAGGREAGGAFYVFDQMLDAWLFLNPVDQTPDDPTDADLVYVYHEALERWALHLAGTRVDTSTVPWVDARWFFVFEADGSGEWVQGEDLAEMDGD